MPLVGDLPRLAAPARCRRAIPASRILGLGWLALLVTAGVVLSAGDARTETRDRARPRRDAHGDAAGRPRLPGGAARDHAHHEPGRPDPARTADVGALRDLAAQQPAARDLAAAGRARAARPSSAQAIARMHAVQLAVTSREALSEYGSRRLRHRLRPPDRRLAAHELLPRQRRRGASGHHLKQRWISGKGVQHHEQAHEDRRYWGGRVHRFTPL